MPEDYELNKTDATEKTEATEATVVNVKVDGFPEIESFVNEGAIRPNQELILNVLNNPENESLKQWLENFLSKKENVLKINVVKSKLSKATDELSIKSIIAGVVEWWYKITDKKSVWGDAWDWENVWEKDIQWESVWIWEKTWDENTEENQNWSLDSHFQQAEEKKENMVQNEEQAVQNENVVIMSENEKNKNDNIREMTNRLMEGLREREQLLAGRSDVDEKTRKEAEKIKNKLPEETKNQLKEKGYDENFINDYILLRVTANEVKKDSSFDKNQVAQFERKVNELSSADIFLKSIDIACNIPDTTVKSLGLENVWQTRTELFNDKVWNQSLIEASKNNRTLKSHVEAYDNLFPEKMWEDDIIAKYWNFLEWDLKAFWQKYMDNPEETKNKINEIKNNSSSTDEDKKFLQDYEDMVSKLGEIKTDTETKTKDMMEELCIVSQIKWMFMCMWEWENFSLNKTNEIRYDEKWAMILDGHVDGVKFSIRQDVNDPEAKLQTSQNLVKSQYWEFFTIWREDNFANSNFILPSQEEIFASIAETMQSDKSLEKSDNQADYLKQLQTKIMENVDKKFVETELVHDYMKEKVKWEKIVDKSLSFIQKTKTNIDFTRPISQDSDNKDLYQFMRILNFNIDNSTDVERSRLEQCITKIEEITDNYRNNNWVEDFVTLKYPLVIDNYLKNKEWLNGWNENSRLSLLSGLFEYYNDKSQDTTEWYENWFTSKIMVNDLYRDLFESNNWNNQSQTADKWDTEQKLNAYNRETQEQAKDAEIELDSVLDDDKTFPPSPKAPWME